MACTVERLDTNIDELTNIENAVDRKEIWISNRGWYEW